jgi:hypothetical protein
MTNSFRMNLEARESIITCGEVEDDYIRNSELFVLGVVSNRHALDQRISFA